ncbi:MAG: PTS mannitol transporter subunit IICB [Bacillota bacterium]
MSIKANVQKVGRFLSAMVMPNIGAFLAWGILTALFISTGYFPNEQLATLVDPILYYLLPLLVGYTAGKMVAGDRGAVMGAIGSIGVIVGSDIPMFLGVMMFAPLSAWIIKQFDKAVEGKIKAGFEMLVNNFSIGIIGAGLVVVGFYLVGPFVTVISNALMAGADFIYDAGLLPLLSIIVEPAKVLFLNNAINHGIMGPIGMAQAAETGKSIMFLIESNPGPGLGILLAYAVFSKGSTKSTASGSAIIHFFGGIHEMYFPFVLMNPAMLLAVIAGGAAGVFTFGVFDVGLVATPAPGSILALLALCPASDIVFMLLGVAVSTVVSFLVASIFVKRTKGGDETFEEAQERVHSDKATAKGVKAETVATKTIEKKIVFACDAGMGSSAMGATTLRKLFAANGIEAKIPHYAINAIPEDTEIVVTQNELVERAKLRVPNAEIYPVKNFMGKGEYDALIEKFKD